MKTLKKAMQVGIVKTMLNILAFFSLKTCHQVGMVIGWLAIIIPNRNRAVTEKNLQLCFPKMNLQQQKQLLRKSLIETGKTFTEAGPMWKWEKDKLFKLIKQVQGEELLTKALENKHGVILALPHLGNWELLSLYVSNKYPTTSMYQRPKMAQLESIIKHGRERMGANLVPADNVGVRAMLKALKNNELVVILPDQEPNTGTGLFAPFFGLQAYSMTLVSRLAKKTQASVIIAYTKRLTSGEGYEITFTDLPEMNEIINTKDLDDSVVYLNNELEKMIRCVPEQYQWSYKRFRNQPITKENQRVNFYNS
ncbi:MAG: lysophospholipid acyltransferase family protein [Gammaproteobacteria bacterium]|nr:lysophospholipid acyltransferase family protein [Gammaproteobacteria bacterium]MCW8987672.1 lysophospholipid acyltransferase family protein [Gammaproteobacteria bacterium]